MALAGEPNAALAHYEQYKRLLADELDVPPPAGTSTLAEQIRKGEWPAKPLPVAESSPSVALPPFLAVRPRPTPMPPFVAREGELAQLESTLAATIAGAGGVVFVVGDAGQGKSALLREFTRRALQDYPTLVVAGGHCSTYGGIEEPLLPFRNILAQLTGDLEAPWAAGLMELEEVHRLWSNVPNAVEALLTHGLDLLGALLSIPTLRARIARMPGSTQWREQLERLASTSPSAAVTTGPPPRARFDQFLAVLRALARHNPLLLWLDDLHWADLDSLALLFYLGQHLAGFSILVVGAYRPEEVALGRDDSPHPLYTVVHELQRRSGHRHVDLNSAEGRDFVHAYLDTEPNRLGAGFRERFYHLCSGHPLFTVELLRAMQEQKDLLHDEAGYWVESSSLAWQRLPVRVGAVIGERLARLPHVLRRLLLLASIQGERFSAEVIAAVSESAVQQVIQYLSSDLERRYRLVRAEGIERFGGKRVTYYRFQHGLFQKYLLDSLDVVEHIHLHEAVAHALEALYQGQEDHLLALAGQLAWHYQQANLPEQAIQNRLLAAQWATRLSAYRDALEHFQQGLAVLDRIPEIQQRRHFELELLTGLASVLAMLHGGASTEVEQTLMQARHISQQLDARPALFGVLRRRWEHHFQRGEIRIAQQLAEQCLNVAERMQEPVHLAEAHNALGTTSYRLGHMQTAQKHLAQARQLADEQRCSGIHAAYGIDIAVNCRVNEAIPLWYLGYPDQARQRINDALRLAEAQADPYTLAFALIFAAGLCQRSHDFVQTKHYAERVAHLSAGHNFAMWQAAGNLYHGWARVASGEFQAGLLQLQESLSNAQRTGLQHVRYTAVLADAYARAGEIAQALALVDGLLVTIAQTEEREWEAELHRQKGELLLAHNDDAVAEAAACFQKAQAVAQEQQAKMLELRAALSLARLWQRQGRPTAAHNSLAAIYAWFTEGFDTPDLQEAQAFLAASRSH
jgi:adenylate cyclase